MLQDYQLGEEVLAGLPWPSSRSSENDMDKPDLETLDEYDIRLDPLELDHHNGLVAAAVTAPSSLRSH
ncbi:MAG: hypothetical protein JOY96_04310 [Verrucomicrobia bacterium]|nr:hypothetical protein [Verrucomicrobiota bacterium]